MSVPTARRSRPGRGLATALLVVSLGACQLVLDPAVYRTRDAAAGDAQGTLDGPVSADAERDAGALDAVAPDAVAPDAVVPDAVVLDAVVLDAVVLDVGPRVDALPSDDARVFVDVPTRPDVGAPDAVATIDVPSPQDVVSRMDVTTSTDVVARVDASDARADVLCGGGCAASQRCCGTACVDTQTSVDHCGGCNQPCPAGATCTGGACVCTGGNVLCLISSRQRCCDALCTLILCL